MVAIHHSSENSDWVELLVRPSKFPKFYRCFECSRAPHLKGVIRKAEVINIGNTSLLAASWQWWQLDRSGKYWSLHQCLYGANPLIRAGRIPVTHVSWAKSKSNNQLDRYAVIGFDKVRVEKWIVVAETRRCEICGRDVRFEFSRSLRCNYTLPCVRCETCVKTIRAMEKDIRHGTAAKLNAGLAFIRNSEIWRLEGRLRSKNLRWVRMYSAAGSFTKKEFELLCASYGNICLSCHQRRKLYPDHIVPIAKGGTNSISNIQPLCGRCNSRKGAKVKDYRKSFPPVGCRRSLRKS